MLALLWDLVVGSVAVVFAVLWWQARRELKRQIVLNRVFRLQLDGMKSARFKEFEKQARRNGKRGRNGQVS